MELRNTLPAASGFFTEYVTLDHRAIANGIFVDTPLPYVSNWQTNLIAALPLPILSTSIPARLDWSYRTDYTTFSHDSPDLILGDPSLLNSSIIYVHNSEKWEASLSGTYITDEFYILGGNAHIGNLGYTNSNCRRPSGSYG